MDYFERQRKRKKSGLVKKLFVAGMFIIFAHGGYNEYQSDVHKDRADILQAEYMKLGEDIKQKPKDKELLEKYNEIILNKEKSNKYSYKAFIFGYFL